MTDVISIFDSMSSQPPDRPALGGLGRDVLCYGQLTELAARTVRGLNDMGIGRGDRVAIVLRNGSEMAAALLAIGAGASVAPLNPTYSEREFEIYLSDLGVKALLVERGVPSPAIAVAKRRAIPILEIDRDENDPAGWFRLHAASGISGSRQSSGMSTPDDETLVLHTSGTTSRPKIVPLLNRNLAVSARNVRDSLQLSPEDIGLNIMPLFHIHGLVTSLYASVVSGAKIVCAPAFDPLKVYRWFDEATPTWYTAVPTMHQAILARANRNDGVIDSLHLRFIRSSSSPLPPSVMANLEQLFKCPVIEAYGMTEAAHQIACNPLPPRRRKAGTVGLPAGPEIAIMGDHGEILNSNQTGEIVIRGANVFPGYGKNQKASMDAFTNGWFRTGDEGFIDIDGYLKITGRLKEIIIRGGEKIAPREVDDVIHAHPAVAQAITFAVPHAKLGEEVAAVIVLKDGMRADEQEIREFVAEHLAKFKVPRHIFFRDHVPKSPSGKPKRIGLAVELGVV